MKSVGQTPVGITMGQETAKEKDILLDIDIQTD